jgi:hypothetical protein
MTTYLGEKVEINQNPLAGEIGGIVDVLSSINKSNKKNFKKRHYDRIVNLIALYHIR